MQPACAISSLARRVPEAGGRGLWRCARSLNRSLNRRTADHVSRRRRTHPATRCRTTLPVESRHWEAGPFLDGLSLGATRRSGQEARDVHRRRREVHNALCRSCLDRGAELRCAPARPRTQEGFRARASDGGDPAASRNPAGRGVCSRASLTACCSTARRRATLSFILDIVRCRTPRGPELQQAEEHDQSAIFADWSCMDRVRANAARVAPTTIYSRKALWLVHRRRS
jgi:hypothetical protein